MLHASNGYTTTLTSIMTSGSTSFTVTSATNVPDVPFLVSLQNEIIQVGNVVGTTFSSLVRGTEGTIASAHAVGTLVENRLTAGTIAEVQNAILTHTTDGISQKVIVDAPSMLGTGTLVTDTLCYKGQKKTYSQPATGMTSSVMAYIDIATLRYFIYSASIRLKTNNITSSTIATFNVKTWNGATWDLISTIPVLGTDFINASTYHVLSLGFDHTGVAINNTIRVEIVSEAIANLTLDIDSIVISQAQVAVYAG